NLTDISNFGIYYGDYSLREQVHQEQRAKDQSKLRRLRYLSADRRYVDSKDWELIERKHCTVREQQVLNEDRASVTGQRGKPEKPRIRIRRGSNQPILRSGRQ